MGRNEDKRVIADRWQGWADLFQYGSLAMLFVTIFVCNQLTKAQARVAVWYFAGFIFITATTGFFLSRKALKLKMTYLHAEADRVSGLFDKAIEQVEKGKG